MTLFEGTMRTQEASAYAGLWLRIMMTMLWGYTAWFFRKCGLVFKLMQLTSG